MTKEELRSFVREKFKELGYQSRGNYFYKIFDDDYLIGFHLYASSYVKGFSFVCGVIYLPDKIKIPIRGVFDLQWEFQFPQEPEAMLDLSAYPDTRRLRRIFEYEQYTLEQLENFFEVNYAFFMAPLLDKNYGLNIIRNNWYHLKRFTPQNVLKLCQRADINSEDVFRYLGMDGKWIPQ